jgi:hypothetical protein
MDQEPPSTRSSEESEWEYEYYPEETEVTVFLLFGR